MSRFLFSEFATQDFDQLSTYIRSLPSDPGLRFAKEIRRTLTSIAQQPLLGLIDARISAICSARVRRRVCRDFLIFYTVENNRAEIIGLVHGRRDIDRIMADRAR